MLKKKCGTLHHDDDENDDDEKSILNVYFHKMLNKIHLNNIPSPQ